MKIEFDENNAGMSYGYYRCSNCESEWYGGGKHLHSKPDCTDDSLTYVIGSEAVTKIMEYGEDYSLNPINESDLRAALPEIAQRFSK